MTADAVALTEWECAWTRPGLIAEPSKLAVADLDWVPAVVPGTAASALSAAGRWSFDDDRDFDAEDWWFRCHFAHPGAGRPFDLALGGLATVADVWLNDRPILSSQSMYARHRVDVTADLRASNELVIRCTALRPLLDERRPRPRWRTRLVADQNLRWFRTSLHGRVVGWSPPVAAVGPWRPVTLEPTDGTRVIACRLHAAMRGDSGMVEVALTLTGTAATAGVGAATVRVGDVAAPLTCTPGPEGTIEARATVELDRVQRWWPATHGDQPLYPVHVEIDGEGELAVGRVGFRTVEVPSLDQPELVVNGAPVFCRGVVWSSPDPVGLAPSAADVRSALEQLRNAGFNMIRLAATGAYESTAFFDACDELGILVWQDLMFSSFDYPDAIVDDAAGEAEDVFAGLSGRPSVAIVCGGGDVYSQAALMGQRADRGLFDDVLARVAAEVLPDVPYVPNTPSGGLRPFAPDEGFGGYYGLGAYRRPLADARTSNVRFATECLTMANIPAPATVDRLRARGIDVHSARWKRRVPRDAGSASDFEDVRDHYARVLYGVDPQEVRVTDPEWYLALGRAAVAEVMASTLLEFRRSGSTCKGALILAGRDVCDGAGFGIVDAAGRVKSPYHPLRRALRPVTLGFVDEGLNGLDLLAFNDSPGAMSGVLTIAVYAEGARIAETEVPLEVPARGEARIRTEDALGRFVDLTYAYRFGPRPVDCVVAKWSIGGDGPRAVYRPSTGPLHRSVVGLRASAARRPGGYRIDVTADRMAVAVTLDAVSPGAVISDDYFDVEPGGTVSVDVDTIEPLRVRVSALNATDVVAVRLEPA